jgi:selenide,water dikinase
VVVGPGDDAGVYLLPYGEAIVETVDIITPVVNDPFTFGAISAANSLSDVYAMGGEPLTVLALIGFSSCDIDVEVIKIILKGAIETLNKAGVTLMGGHSFEDSELKFGLSVTGIVEKDKVLRQRGSQSGDIIFLTKPIGIGILTTALKGRKISEGDLREAVAWMLRLNDAAARVAIESGATSATDVTGFGLLGHAYNMVRDSQCDFVLEHKKIPVLPKVRDLVDAGMVPEGAYNNLKFLENALETKGDISEEEKLILADPQTSGGLLITLPEDKVDIFHRSGDPFFLIGRVESGNGKIKIV